MKCGIYLIENVINKKVYVGSSQEIEKRWLNHRSDLRRNTHPNLHLQSAWNKYKERSFSFKIICEVSKDKLIQTEQIFLDALQSYKQEYGYNFARFAKASARGTHPTQEARAKMSAAHKGKPSHRKGKPHTKETRAKMSCAAKGKIRSLEHCKNISLAKKGKPGKSPSLETRKKMSVSHKGRKHGPMSKEQKDKLRILNLGENHPNYGISWSEERREKIMAKQAETSEKKRIAMKALWARKKLEKEYKKSQEGKNRFTNLVETLDEN